MPSESESEPELKPSESSSEPKLEPSKSDSDPDGIGSHEKSIMAAPVGWWVACSVCVWCVGGESWVS